MKLDFSSIPIRSTGFSDQPMRILNDAEPKAMLCSIVELAMLETGSPAARERWQQVQLRNLLKHASLRSAFWKKRIGGKRLLDISLNSLPILARQDVREQFTKEGSLLQPADGIPTKRHWTSGSSGTPVQFWVSAINGQYNGVRSIAQFFMEGLDVSFNWTRIKPAASAVKHGFTVQESQSYMGPLAPLIKSGASKHIEYLNPDFKKLLNELERNEVGYLICAPRVLETMISLFGPSFLKRTGTKMWISLAQAVTDDMKKIFADLQIPNRSNYSSEEVGPIGYECATHPGYFHVATSNVIVEIVDASYNVDGVKLGKVLVTHLNSYATPFIRYDLGDLACLDGGCPCGHQGPTISRLHGKVDDTVKHRDGRRSSFRIPVREFMAIVDFQEYRIRQTEFEKFVVEIGGRSELSADEIAAVTAFLKNRVGQEFEIEIKATQEIDWGQNRKREGFRCEVA